MIKKRRVLVVAHGHPDFQAGGGENAAYALHRGFLKRDGWDSFYFAACTDSAQFLAQKIQILSSQSEAVFHVVGEADQSVFTSCLDLSSDGPLAELVERLNPDIIHLHHFLYLGVAGVAALRQYAPKARILLTLHDFLLLCPLDGQLRRADGQICSGPDQSACLKCCSWLTERQWMIRQEAGHELLKWVDLFVSPSHALVKRFVANGWPSQRFCVIENCLPHWLQSPFRQSELNAEVFSRDSMDSSLHDVFGFFGNCRAVKGLDLILEAFSDVVASFPHARLQVHGPLQSVLDELSLSPWSEDMEYRERINHSLGELKDSVDVVGPYKQFDIAKRMAGVGWVVMASRWLENSPVVIQEARACRRPLLVPDVGGMAEKVWPSRDGWHWTFGDACSLKRRMKSCCEKPDEWRQMLSGMCGPQSNAQIIAMHEALYLSG